MNVLSKKEKNSKTTIICGVLGGLIGLLLVFLSIKYYKNKKEKNANFLDQEEEKDQFYEIKIENMKDKVCIALISDDSKNNDDSQNNDDEGYRILDILGKKVFSFCNGPNVKDHISKENFLQTHTVFTIKTNCIFYLKKSWDISNIKTKIIKFVDSKDENKFFYLDVSNVSNFRNFQSNNFLDTHFFFLQSHFLEI